LETPTAGRSLCRHSSWRAGGNRTGSADDAAIRSLKNDRDLFALRKLLVEVDRRSAPLRNRPKRANDVCLGHGDAPVFTSTDRRHMFAIEADQNNTRRALASAHIDRGPAVLCHHTNVGKG
jgi:hypothetical protein